ncbi:hypothetical protein AGMMS49974_03050 [Deltaproteobacteria bacterium]|nr:hypothetical protein AGMMS49974_03050 [Deltaproteobacteria bacterium]
MELELLKMKVGTHHLAIDIAPLLKVTVEQFHGIEHEDFPCQTARVDMWLMDHQINLRVAEQFGAYYARLPLTQSATIFNGARVMSKAQKENMINVFKGTKGVGNLDYVTAWYKKAADLMAGTTIRTAFVSTNSITQGEQPAILWEPLFENHNVKIDFAYRTFKWSNEAKGKAAVHCVIIGFSIAPNNNQKLYMIVQARRLMRKISILI